jgi:hypothetical protein
LDVTVNQTLIGFVFGYWGLKSGLQPRSQPFSLVIFLAGSRVFALLAWDRDPPTYASSLAGITVCDTIPSLLIEMGSC